MKTHKFTAIVAIMLMGLFMASCDEEKDIIVIDGNIPIKTSTLYIVGDATPALWDVNNMYPLEMSEEDHLVFIYDGNLSQGELKAYLTQGSWDQAPCVRPMTAGSPISKAYRAFRRANNRQIRRCLHYFRYSRNHSGYPITTTDNGIYQIVLYRLRNQKIR